MSCFHKQNITCTEFKGLLYYTHWDRVGRRGKNLNIGKLAVLLVKQASGPLEAMLERLYTHF
jgi:hypothetical protein